MNLKDFYTIATRLIQLLEPANIVGDYQSLIAQLNEIQANPTPELQGNLNQTLENVSEKNLSLSQEISQVPHADLLLKTLKLDGVFGEKATDRLKTILSTELYMAPPKIEGLVQETSSSLEQLKAIVDNFNKFGVEFEEEPKSAILSIEFGEEYRVETPESLAEAVTEVQKVYHAFARLASDSHAFEDPKIRSLSKSSPLLLDLYNEASPYINLAFLARGIKWAMDRVEQSYDIRIKHEDLKAKKMTNASINAGFRQLENKPKSASEINKFVNEIYEDAKPDPNVSGAKTEVKKAVKEATTKLVDMVDKGAVMNVFPPPEDVELEGSVREEMSNMSLGLSMNHKRIAEQQKELKQLGGPKEEPDPQEEPSQENEDQ